MPRKSAAATAASFTAPAVDESAAQRGLGPLSGSKASGKAYVGAPTPKPEPRRGIPIMFVRFTMQLEFGEWLEQIRPNRPIGYELELVGNLLHVRWEDRNTKVRELVLVPTSMIRSMRAFPEKPAKTE